MSLLIFSGQSNPSSDLIDLAHRQIVATELNAAILTSFSQDKDPKLPTMLKILKWAQDKLDEKVVFPKLRDLSTGEIEYVEMMDI
jgi:glucose-induced degradation protein 8